MPVWTPDGKHIAYFSTSGGFGIFWVRSDGSGAPQRLLRSSNTLYPWSFSPDGRRLAYHAAYDKPGDDLWTVTLDTTDPDRPTAGEPQQFLHEPIDNQFPAFSPDGRWIAYRSYQTGDWQVCVRPFPGPGGQWQISPEGGILGWWSNNGHELFFRAPDSRLMVVDYTVKGDSFVAGRPRLWTDSHGRLRPGHVSLDLAPDGKRFIGLLARETPQTEKGSVHVTFLENFFDELRRRIPPGK
jgi:serine/threonine-protein kinase